jgi:hypothetical protein
MTLMDPDRLLADLNRWAAERRTDEAAAARARERSLRQQASESATLAGLLVDLAERRATVVARTTTGASHRGTAVLVGLDFVALAGTGDAPLTLLALHGLTSVRLADSGPPGGAAQTDRGPGDLDLGTVLAGAAADRPRVRLVLGSERVSGELVGAGLDVITVRTDGHPPAVVYLPLASLLEVSLLDSAG